MVFDTIVFEEGLGLWCPEKEHEILVGVPSRKCTSNESVVEEVTPTGRSGLDTCVLARGELNVSLEQCMAT